MQPSKSCSSPGESVHVTVSEYFLPKDYRCNRAATYDVEDARYWNRARLENSLAYQAAVYQWAIQLIRDRGLTSVADFGCGIAAKLAKLHAALPAIDVWGLDQPNAVAMCRRHYDFGNWFELDLDRPAALPPRQFDLVVSSDVIEHLDNPDQLLDAIRGAVHEHSIVLLSTPDRVRLRGANNQRSPQRISCKGMVTGGIRALSAESKLRNTRAPPSARVQPASQRQFLCARNA